MTKKKALITGITGQDGAYLARFLIEKNYEVHGTQKRVSTLNTKRIHDLIEGDDHQVTLHHADMTDAPSLNRVVQEVKPDELYNLAAQSHVAISFQTPEFTANANSLGTLRLLEAIRMGDLEKKTRFYQASTSELYGLVQEIPQTETTPFYPKSPYAIAKLYAHWITINYRETYGIYACNGILFNHESPIRGETFVTRKITRSLSRIKFGLEKCLYLGNLNALRDWGHAKEYVKMQWLILQQDQPEDFVIATGKQTSVRKFAEIAARYANFDLQWEGKNESEIGIDANTGRTIVRVDPRFYRDAEVQTLVGNPAKAMKKLGWIPQMTLEDLVADMMKNDMNIAKKESMYRNAL